MTSEHSLWSDSKALDALEHHITTAQRPRSGRGHDSVVKAGGQEGRGTSAIVSAIKKKKRLRLQRAN